MKKVRRIAIMGLVAGLGVLLVLIVFPPSTTTVAKRADYGEGDRPLPEVVRLEKMNIFKDRITLSGFSAGASMAIQTHMSHSRLFSGLAIFSQSE